ncbi:NUDIX hydrolase domain-like protein [Absidia repens]|uniref:NUDIX hydrolase domain-like protein n=1 Tax=Absidia repens TaxID=90262 RepID=A0A1X2IW46_9FUNG|nr:NUDIX hydrolase domain-like protein [Absidia repens]
MSISSKFDPLARTGRDNQTYDDKHARQVAGCLPIDVKNQRVLLVQSSKHDHVWVMPKGGWENDETVEQAAARETYEEAGVCGNIVGLIGDYMDYDKFGFPKTHFWFFEMHVQEVLDSWPEMRQRRWFSLDEAMHMLRFKPIMQRVLQQSSFAQSSSQV